MEELFGECCGFVLSRLFLTAYIFLIETQIVERRESIIKNGRALQDSLHIPECICVFTKEDPGMADENLRWGGIALAFSFLFAVLGLGCRLPSVGTFWDSGVIFLGLVIPTCINSLTFLILILAKRRRSSFLRRHGYFPPEEDLKRPVTAHWIYD